ncbi:hypothetical protein ABPG75_011727 [Micractinium tetrahymenae]
MALMSTQRYFWLSTLAAAALVWHAFATREQFFPAMVYLSSSKISLAVLGNMGFALALATYKLLLRVFLGRLRDSELERVNDKVGQAVVETCLAMTIFREDFTATFLSMFVILSFVKIFHWLVQDRVDFIETTPNVSRLQHFRIVTFTLVLLAIDVAFLKFSLHETLNPKSSHGGVSVFLLFAFEYTVQASTIVLTFVKYCLSMADLAMEGRWEGKGVAVFYLELTLDMLHLLVYCAFFAVVFSTYGIPLHLVRDLYWTFRNFQTRVRDFLRYRRITANMDQGFPDASEEDLQRADHTCIICREEMNSTGRNKKLSCSHVFHLHCLRSWLERQQNCPICRRSVMPPPRAGAPAHANAAAAAGPVGGAPAGAARGAADELAAAAERVRAAAAEGLAAGAGPAAAPDLAAFAPPPAADAAAAAAAAAGGAPLGGQLRRRRGWRVPLFGGNAAAGAAVAPGVPGLEGWQVVAPVAPYPQWVPAAPMALFVPAGGLPQIQYAGQQHPEQVLAAQQHAAAAAAAAASMLPLMMPLQPFVLPPVAVPGQAVGAASGAASAAPANPQQHAAAVAAASAAAASLLGPFAVGTPGSAAAAAAAVPADPVAAAGSAAAAAAMERVLQQQLAALRAHQEQARQAQQAQQQGAGAGVGHPAPAVAPDSSASPGAAPPAPQGSQPAPSSSAAAESAAPLAQPSSGGGGGASTEPAAPAGPRADAAAPVAAAESAQHAGAEQAQQAPAADQAAEQGQREEDSEAEAIRRRRLERFGAAP